MTDSTAPRQKQGHTAPSMLKMPFSVWMWVLAILLLGSVVTFVISNVIQDRTTQLALKEFNRQVDVATNQLENAIEKDKTLTVALQGMFHAFGTVSREEFSRFVAAVDIERLFPDTKALSWNALVPVKDTVAFERAVRLDTSLQAEGYPDFAIKPAGAVEPQYVVTYIEPMAGNEGAFGFDIGSNPTRRRTVELARDRAEARATAPITLAQETGTQKGFLLMMPVYQSITPGSIEARREQFRGVVVAVFRIGDLIEGSGDLGFSALRVRDVTDADESVDVTPEVIYEKGLQDLPASHESLVRRIDVAGRRWEVVYSQSTQALSSDGVLSRWAVPALGGLSTALAAMLIAYLATSRQRTLVRAELLTIDLQRANDELSQSNNDLSQFAHVASHDLQTPVRNIMGSVSMLEDAIGENPDDDIERYLQFLKDSALRMKTLISDLLTYAESGQSLDHQEIDLNTTLELVAAVTRDICESQNASLQIAEMPRVPGDEQQLERVFTNLITNALKYSKADEPPRIDVSARQAGQYHEIRIRDNGLGIDPACHKSIFEPFKRLHRQNDIAGTGLGLAICRQIVDRHGGTIGVEESSEQGTTILLRLPGIT
ncbi:CHASE domain-containing protein [Granulosicoccus sp. 3-233]|uniref:CHASE domain-containing protein n=1 Tax=Granulosicoccus sp. 3-233 TaxID=3417969 RepID=UPI003D32C0B7